jgi:hypothetical protein
MKGILLIFGLLICLFLQLNAQLVKFCNGGCSDFRVESTINNACGSNHDLVFTIYNLTGKPDITFVMYAEGTDGKWHDYWNGEWGFYGSNNTHLDHIQHAGCNLTGRYLIYYYDNYPALYLKQWNPAVDSIPGEEYVNKMFGSGKGTSTAKIKKKDNGYLFLIAKERWNSYQVRNSYGLKKNVKLRVYFSNIKGISEFNCKNIGQERWPVEIELCANEQWVKALKSNGLNPDDFEIECVTGDPFTIGNNFFPDENSAGPELQRRKEIESHLEFQTLKDLTF